MIFEELLNVIAMLAATVVAYQLKTVLIESVRNIQGKNDL